MKRNSLLVGILAFCLLTTATKSYGENVNAVWSKEKAAEWYAPQPWLSGCNFQPSSAINQIEMWQAETFDVSTIDKELGWAEGLGFNVMRVFLSSVVWKADPQGLKSRMNKYLEISTKHGIKTMFVFFDDCWNPESAIGKQPEPKLGVHNSGWVQDPSCSLRLDTTKLFPVLEGYVKDILTSFKNDKRILLWDLYNEPGNGQHINNSLPLLKSVFKWARQINPSQPLSSGVWSLALTQLNEFQIANSDIITYHNYQDATAHKNDIEHLEMQGRPIICTEYMARRNNSLFKTIMPLLNKKNIGAINWGFVSGKTNTIFAWDEPKADGKEPALWFHDIYRQDKSPFDSTEVNIIKKMNGKSSKIKLIDTESFKGKVDGKDVLLYTLTNRQGMVAQITNFGGRIISLWTADKNQDYKDVVTGFKTFKEYQSGKEVYFGALIGRCGNRIAKGKFTLDGKKYQLATNNNGNHLHGGPKGFHNVVWEARQYKNENDEDALELKYLSPDGEEGYPGNLASTVIYTLTDKNELKIEYAATTDKPTIVNLTHHSFFNLHGFSDGVAKSINSHILQIKASNYTPTDNGLIPTGVIAPVKDTPMDFMKPKAIGKRVDDAFVDLANGKGYDHNWILNNNGDYMREAAVIFEPATGIQMRVITDQPALQFYGGNFFQGKDTGKYGEVYNFRTSFALETQHYPDSPNVPKFPSIVLRPTEKYKHVCIYKFEVK